MIIKVNGKTQKGLEDLATSLDMSMFELISFILVGEDIECIYSGSPE